MEALTDPPSVWIGKTQGPVREYLCSAQARCPVALKLIAICSGPRGTKALIHAKFQELRTHSEWFTVTAELSEFLATLPKGEPLPAGVIETWATRLRTEDAVAVTPPRIRAHSENLS